MTVIKGFMDFAMKDSSLPDLNDDPCPSCGGATEIGYGLAGGGLGIYSYCPRCCIVTSKSTEPGEDPSL